MIRFTAKYIAGARTCLLSLISLFIFPLSIQAEKNPIPFPVAIENHRSASGEQYPAAFHYYLDKKSLSLSDIQDLPIESWNSVSSKDINKGYTSSILWIRIQAINESDEILAVFLEEDFTLIRNIQATVIAANGSRNQSFLDRTKEFNERAVHFANPVLPIELPPGKFTIYVRLQSDMDMIAALQFWSPEGLKEDAKSRLLLFGILYGSVLLMALYNGLIWLSLKDRTYLLYALYSLAFLFYFLSYYGHGAQFVWGHWPWFEQRAVPIVMAIQIGVFGAEFFRLFLSIDERHPWQYRSLRFIQIFSIGLLIASFTIPPARVIVVYPIYAICAILLIAAISIIRYRQGFQPAIFSIFAFLILWVSGIGSSLRSLGIVPYNDITMYGVAFGNVAELLLLSFCLGYRLRKLEDETANTGRKNQSLTGLLQGLPYAILLRQDKSLIFANRAAHDLYRDRNLPDWQDSGIHAFRHMQKDRWIAVHVAQIEIEGKPARLQFHSEITEEMESKLALEEKHTSTMEARDQSEENRQSQDEFLQSMTTEIRKPMSAVYQAADVLNQLNLNPDQKELAGILLRSASTLISLLNDLADLSRLESGRIAINPMPCNPRQAVNDTAELFRTAAQSKGLSLEVIAEGLPGELMLDAARVQQVLSNLVSNGVKFTDQGAIQIRAKYLNQGGSGQSVDGSGPSGQLQISVADQGPGIPEEKMHRLFRRFEQLDPGTYRRFGGTGLGLAISRGMVESMGGQIGCENLPERGSLFWFKVPASIVSRSGGASKKETQTSLKGIVCGLTIATDDSTEMLESQLKLLGIQVVRLDGTDTSHSRQEMDFMIVEESSSDFAIPAILWNATAEHSGNFSGPIVTPPCSTKDLEDSIRELLQARGRLS